MLKRLRHPDDQAAWERFVDLYTALLLLLGSAIGLLAKSRVLSRLRQELEGMLD